MAKDNKSQHFQVQKVPVFCKLIFMQLKLAWPDPSVGIVEIFRVECRGLSSERMNDETILRTQMEKDTVLEDWGWGRVEVLFVKSHQCPRGRRGDWMAVTAVKGDWKQRVA